MKIYRTFLCVCILVFVAITVGYLLYHYNEKSSISDATLIWEEKDIDDDLYQG